MPRQSGRPWWWGCSRSGPVIPLGLPGLSWPLPTPSGVAAVLSPLTQPAGIFKNQHRETHSPSITTLSIACSSLYDIRLLPVKLWVFMSTPLSYPPINSITNHDMCSTIWLGIWALTFTQKIVFLNIGRHFYYLSLDDTCIYFLSIQTGNLDDNVFFWLFYFTLNSNLFL